MLHAAVLRRSCPHLLALVRQLVRISALWLVLGALSVGPCLVGWRLSYRGGRGPPTYRWVQPWLGLWGMLAGGWGGWGLGFCALSGGGGGWQRASSQLAGLQSRGAPTQLRIRCGET